MSRALLGAAFVTAGVLHFVKMALHTERFRRFPRPLVWARLPLQGALIAWVWRTATR